MPYNGRTPPPGPQHAELERRRRRKRAVRGVFGVVTLVFASLALIAIAAGVALSHLSFGFDLGYSSRKHLAPIPISKDACPNVVVMHQTAGDFQKAMPFLGVGFDARGKIMPWAKTKARLLRATNRLDFAIVASTPKFPPRVQHYLANVHRDLTIGRRKLINARDGARFTDNVGDIANRGQTAFGYAGDLIGRQCRVPLGV